MTRTRKLSTALALALSLPALIAGCGGDDGGGEDPAEVLKAALTNDSAVDSGVIDVSLSGSAEGEKSGEGEISIAGPFQGGGGEPIELDFEVSGSVSGSAFDQETDSGSREFEGGVTLAGDELFVNYQGTEYAAGESLNSQLAPLLEAAAETPNSAGGSTPEEAEEFIDRLEGLSNEGSEVVDGVATTKISAEVDIIELIEAQAEGLATPIPVDTSQLEGQNSSLDFFIGEDDIVRQIDLSFAFDLPEEPSAEGVESIEGTLSAGVGDVNEAQTIEAPADAEPIDGLLEQLGVDPAALEQFGALGGLGALGGGGLGGLDALGGGGATTPGNAEQDAVLKCIAESDPAEVDKCFE